MLLLVRLLSISTLFFSFACHSHSNEPETQTVKVGALTLHYEFADSRSSGMESEFTETIVAGIQHYRELFDGYPRDLQGFEYNEITVKVRYGEHLSGEADPQLLILTWSERGGFGVHNWRTILLHEIFHLWNAESFRYASSRESWFSEGVSEFYAFQAATQLGIISGSESLAVASQPIGYYNSAGMLERLSLREAAIDNHAKLNNYFLVYHGGWVTAMILDHDLRTRTDNQCSLDHVMRYMYQQYRREDHLYNSEDIRLAIQSSCELDYKDFFERYIEGTEALNVSKYFDLGRAFWDFEFGSRNEESTGIIYQTLGIVRGKGE